MSIWNPSMGSDWNSMVLSMLRPRGPLEFYGLVLRKMIAIIKWGPRI